MLVVATGSAAPAGVNAGLAAAQAGVNAGSAVGPLIPTQIEIYGNEPQAALAMQGNPGATYAFCCSALTASTQTNFFNLGLSTVVYARWKLVWNPRGGGGVRLVHMDSGPANITEMARLENGATTPIVSAVEVTTMMRSLVGDKVAKHVGQQSKGGPIIYSSILEIYCQAPAAAPPLPACTP